MLLYKPTQLRSILYNNHNLHACSPQLSQQAFEQHERHICCYMPHQMLLEQLNQAESKEELVRLEIRKTEVNFLSRKKIKEKEYERGQKILNTIQTTLFNPHRSHQ